jgi:hypothetical protein
MVTTGVAGLIAGGKRVVNIAPEPKRFPPDGMDNRVTVAPQLRVFCFKTFDELEEVGGRVILESLAKKAI